MRCVTTSEPFPRLPRAQGKKGWSFFSPRSWFGYGKLQEVGVASQAQDERVNSAANNI